jgi:flagellar FliL protein
MAEADDKKAPQAKGKGQKESAAEAAEKPKRKLPLKLIAIAVGGVLLLGGGGWAAYRHFSATPGPGAESAAKSKEAAAAFQTVTMDAFIVNLVDPLGRRYLKAKVELEVDKPEVVEEAHKHDPQIRDSIITLLSAKSYSDIDSPEGKTQLRQEIVSRANQFLRQGKVVNAYFTDFVVQ